MEINIIPDTDRPLSWRVEQIDSDGDGGIDLAIFSGPISNARARAYANILRRDPIWPIQE